MEIATLPLPIIRTDDLFVTEEHSQEIMLVLRCAAW